MLKGKELPEERMIKVDQKETLRRFYFIKRHSIRQIAEEFHRSRKTVRKAIADASVPQYCLAAPKPSPVMGPWLEANKARPVKQRHTALRSEHLLTTEGGATGPALPRRLQGNNLRPRLNEM